MTKFSVIGYEGSTISQFLSCLTKNDVDMVIDVREHPVSRKPGFSQSALHKKLLDSGVQYYHFASLGCPDVIRDKYKETGDWNTYALEYNKFLKGRGDDVQKLSLFFSGYYCALLCFEANPYRCHRSLIARALMERYPDLTATVLTPEAHPQRESLASQTRLCFS